MGLSAGSGRLASEKQETICAGVGGWDNNEYRGVGRDLGALLRLVEEGRTGRRRRSRTMMIHAVVHTSFGGKTWIRNT